MQTVRQTAAVVGLAVLAGTAAWFAMPEPAVEAPADVPLARVVSLAPAITETIAYLGAEDRLVGRSDWCGLPPSVKQLPALGSTMTPSWEALVATRPDRVFVEANQSTPLAELQAVAPTTALSWLTLDQMQDSVTALGAALDLEGPASELHAALERELRAEAPVDGPRVLLLMGTPDLGQGEVWFIRTNSLHGRVLSAAGARNAIERAITGPPSLSLEQLVAVEVDAILVLVDGELSEPERAAVVDAFASLEPLADTPVGVLARPGLLATGPSLLELVRDLRAALKALLP